MVVNRKTREGAGAKAGEAVVVEMERDDEPRVVEVPPELERALACDGTARDHFEQLSYSHRKEYADWIAEAKREETRQRRAHRAAEMLARGEKLR